MFKRKGVWRIKSFQFGALILAVVALPGCGTVKSFVPPNNLACGGSPYVYGGVRCAWDTYTVDGPTMQSVIGLPFDTLLSFAFDTALLPVQVIRLGVHAMVDKKPGDCPR